MNRDDHLLVRRRLLLQAAAAAALVPALPGCARDAGEAHAAGPLPAIGTNLSGMEWSKPNVRRGASTQPNLHYTVPRKAEVAWLAANGFRKNRLPVLWEMLQPVLHDARPNAATRALVGEPGEFHAAYAQQITDVLDAHAAVGATCILDLHNYCRYRDFRYAADGSVPGLRPPPTPWHRPYTEDPAGIQERIFALAGGATLTQAHYADFWTRAARRWKDHPGLAGWGLMNEPHDMPAPGRTEPTEGGGEDLAIWPAYARVGVEAIRRVDTRLPIYVAGNAWSAAMALADSNPGFPLAGENLVYEVHLYLDASSAGHAFDYETEVRKGYSAGLGKRSIDADTGAKRLDMAVRWARKHNARLALTEVGMPLDDERWQEMFLRTMTHALRHGVEVMSWMGGSHWPIRNYPIHHVPGWHQNRTLVPAVAGPMLQAAGASRAVLYDDGGGWAPPGQPVTVTLYARGALAAPLQVQVADDAGGRLGKTVLTLPAGANGQDSYTYVPPAGKVATLTYSAPGDVPLPPPRRVYGLADPVEHAGRDLAQAANAILARHRAGRWAMADAWTDYLQGAPAQEGQAVRAVADSGWASSPGNAMEMLCFLNTDRPEPGPWKPPVLRVANGRKGLQVLPDGGWGLWCKKTAPQPGVVPRPRNRMPFDLHDEHFAIAVITPQANGGGTILQASRAEEGQASELLLAGGVPQARWTDGKGAPVLLAGRSPLPPGQPAVLTLASEPGGQVLRVNGEPVARASARLPEAVFAQLLLGWGFTHYYPREPLRGLLHVAVAGRGRPSDAELAVLERYLLELR